MSVELISKTNCEFVNINVFDKGANTYWFVDLTTQTVGDSVIHTINVRHYRDGGMDKRKEVNPIVYDFLKWTLDNNVSMFLDIIQREISNAE